ncbi:hypothetical protein [Anoxybacillus kestanbolensis]|uniref:hypothetical protein n=1 Tax=Anoxybacillus kestanbolensis TaxID=227476 RepID=UPI003D1F8E70
MAPVLQKTETYHAEKIKGQKLSYCVLKKELQVVSSILGVLFRRKAHQNNRNNLIPFRQFVFKKTPATKRCLQQAVRGCLLQKHQETECNSIVESIFLFLHLMQKSCYFF